MQKREKKGMLYEDIIYLTLNLIFFAVLLMFVVQSKTGKGIYEESYAKEIALLIDGAKPEMTIFLDMSEGLEIADKNNFDRRNVVEIDNTIKEVRVRLGSQQGYSYGYFSDVNINQTKIQGNELAIQIVK